MFAPDMFLVTEYMNYTSQCDFLAFKLIDKQLYEG